MPISQEEKNKIEFLLSEYSNFWMGKIRTEGLLRALKKLPADMILRKDEIVTQGPGLPPAFRDKTVKDRIEELGREDKMLGARLETTTEQLAELPGGKEAIKNWQWKTSGKSET